MCDIIRLKALYLEAEKQFPELEFSSDTLHVEYCEQVLAMDSKEIKNHLIKRLEEAGLKTLLAKTLFQSNDSSD